MVGRDIVGILGAYLLGGFCAGYYLVLLQLRTDIRDHGSGGVGARNVGRLLGRAGFAATLTGDLLKGLLAVFLARKFELTDSAVSLVVLAVVAGHIWPLPLGFRGGRGIATAIGAYLFYDPVLALLLLGLTLGLMLFRRGFIISGLAAFLLLPPLALGLDYSGHTVAVLAATAAIILFAHRERIRSAFAESLPTKEA
jgi:glycerol-3-phosphate acyltransferase PlsY